MHVPFKKRILQLAYVWIVNLKYKPYVARQGFWSRCSNQGHMFWDCAATEALVYLGQLIGWLDQTYTSIWEVGEIKHCSPAFQFFEMSSLKIYRVSVVEEDFCQKQLYKTSACKVCSNVFYSDGFASLAWAHASCQHHLCTLTSISGLFVAIDEQYTQQSTTQFQYLLAPSNFTTNMFVPKLLQ